MSGCEQKLKKKSNPDFDRLQKLKKRPTESTAIRQHYFIEKSSFFGKNVLHEVGIRSFGS